MKKSRIVRAIAAVESPAVWSLPLVELLVDTKAELFEWHCQGGISVLPAPDGPFVHPRAAEPTRWCPRFARPAFLHSPHVKLPGPVAPTPSIPQHILESPGALALDLGSLFRPGQPGGDVLQSSHPTAAVSAWRVVPVVP